MAIEAMVRALAVGRQKAAPLAPAVGGTINLTGIRQLPRRGTPQLLEAYSETPWLRAVMGKVSFAVGTAGWEVWRETGAVAGVSRQLRRASPNRRKLMKAAIKRGEIEMLPGHPALDVLESPNPYMTGCAMMGALETHASLVGDAFGLVEHRVTDGTPKELWPIPPHWVTEIPGPGRPAEFAIKAQGGTAKQYPLDAMVWVRDLDPLNPYGRGSGYGRSLSDEIDADELAAKHQKAIMNNQARPDLIVQVPGASPDQLSAYQEAWASKFQGSHKARLPQFTSRESVQIHEIQQQSLADLQLVELRKFERDLIIEVFGVPPEKLGITESSNRATIEAADFFFAKDVIVPRLVRLRDALNMPAVTLADGTVIPGRFITRWGEDLFLDYVSPVEEDRQHQLAVMTAAGYAFTDDEKRALADHEPLPDGEGEIKRVPFNLVSEPVGEGVPSVELSAPVETKGAAPEIAKADAADAPRIERIVQSVDFQTLRDLLMPSIQGAYVAAAEEAIGEIGIGIAFAPADPNVVEFLQQNAATNLRHVNATTRRAVRGALSDGFEAREGVEGLAKRIEDVFEAARGRRARVIARTESTRASSRGAEEGIRQAGVEEKEWVAVQGAPTEGPGAVRESHQRGFGLDGTHVPVDGMFVSPVTGAIGPGPGEMGSAAEDINCRCVLVAFFPDEERSLGRNDERAGLILKRRESVRATHERAMIRALVRAFTLQREAALAALAGDR
ncbi:MAG TPA: phage portal protein [Polyangia bacterium]|nr:phage portal protein [Polyangia bacterium]